MRARRPIAREPARHLLLVDDDALYLRDITRWLSRVLPYYWAVHRATSVRGARRLIASLPRIDAAVLDIIYADHPRHGNGFDLLASLRERRPGVPAVFLTGYCRPDLVDRAAAAGAPFMCKEGAPENIRVFLERVETTAAPPPAEGFGARVDAYACCRRLSRRERTILDLAARANSQQDMVAELGITLNTLKWETRRLLRKCGRFNNLREIVHHVLRRVSRERPRTTPEGW